MNPHTPKSAAENFHARLARVMSRARPLFGLFVGFALFAAAAPRAHAVGATTPFATIEAESGTLVGGAYVSSITPEMPRPTAATVETEASGYALVHLVNTGDSVTLTNNTGITSNTIVVRVSIPDAPSGGGRPPTPGPSRRRGFRQAATPPSP